MKGSFFRVPAILFDSSMYPKCFGVSENAFRWYIYSCSAINTQYGTHRSTHIAVKKYLGLEEEEHQAAQKQLVNNHLIFLHHKGKAGNRYTANKDYKGTHKIVDHWGICNPPLVQFNEKKSKFELKRPPAESKTGKAALFHLGKTSFEFICVPCEFVYIEGCKDKTSAIGPLAHLTVDQIYCYFNLLRQDRSYWFGVNPNFVRYELSSDRIIHKNMMDIADYLSPREDWGDKFCVSPILLQQTQKAEDELKVLIRQLIEHGLLTWQFWLASPTTYYERRRSIDMSYLRLIRFFDSQSIIMPLPQCAETIIGILQQNKNLKLVAQLCSRFKMDPKFEQIISRNCADRQISKVLDALTTKGGSEK